MKDFAPRNSEVGPCLHGTSNATLMDLGHIVGAVTVREHVGCSSFTNNLMPTKTTCGGFKPLLGHEDHPPKALLPRTPHQSFKCALTTCHIEYWMIET